MQLFITVYLIVGAYFGGTYYGRETFIGHYNEPIDKVAVFWSILIVLLWFPMLIINGIVYVSKKILQFIQSLNK